MFRVLSLSLESNRIESNRNSLFISPSYFSLGTDFSAFFSLFSQEITCTRDYSLAAWFRVCRVFSSHILDKRCMSFHSIRNRLSSSFLILPLPSTPRRVLQKHDVYFYLFKGLGLFQCVRSISSLHNLTLRRHISFSSLFINLSVSLASRLAS